MELILTLLTGLCFTFGYLIGFFGHNKEKINIIAISLAFVILLNLICFDIFPEVMENFNLYSLLFIICGLLILKVFDLLIPHHTHHHEEHNDNKIEHEGHSVHIGLITVLALFLHNVLEAMALYSLATENLKSGLIMALGVALHNIPLGLQLSSGIKNKNIIYLILLSLSGLFGGIICMNIGLLGPNIENYILCFTLGMLLYLVIFEFFPELWRLKKHIYTLYGIIIGIVFVILTFII